MFYLMSKKPFTIDVSLLMNKHKIIQNKIKCVTSDTEYVGFVWADFLSSKLCPPLMLVSHVFMFVL